MTQIAQSHPQNQFLPQVPSNQTHCQQLENQITELAAHIHGTASHVERLVRQYRKVKRIEALELDNERHAVRQLDWYFDDDESLVLKGRFTPEQGLLIKKVLQSIMDEDFLEQQDVSAETPVDELKPLSEPISQRRADALVRMAQGYSSKPRSAGNGDRYLINIHTDKVNCCAASREGALGYSETLRADGTGAEAETLSVGRKTRTIPPAIRRALKRRDHGCQFPGCTCSRFVDAHHIVHWADGGETSLNNLVLLCRRHHRLVHEGGFGVHTKADGQVFFTDQQHHHLPQT